MKKIPVFLIITSFFVVSCSTKYLIPTDADVKIAQSHWQGTTIEQLNQGYNIFMDKCTDCHKLKKPQKFSEADWDNIMPKMGRKSKLDSTRYSNVFHYIIAKREAVLKYGKKHS